jgi:penicillin-binding protein 1C
MARPQALAFGVRFLAASSVACGAFVGIVGLVQLVWLTPVPLASVAARQGEVRDRQGQLLRAGYDRDAHRFVPAGEGIDRSVVAQVFVAAEDHRLRAHAGVDARAALRACADFLRSGRLRSGASTMAMQLVRLREGRRPGFQPWHKLRDAVLALRLTRAIGPEGVLRAYLDEVPLGPRVIGVEAGARAAFGKGARDLSLAEAAVLASFARSPATLARAPHSEAVRERVRRRALGTLAVVAREGTFVRDAETAVPALVNSLVGERPQGVPASTAGRLGALAESTISTLDLPLQRAAEAALRAGLVRNKARGVSHGAAVLVDLDTMGIRALCTLSSEGEAWFDATSMRRQPGSALKPLLAALALEEFGDEDLVIDDAPLAFEGDDDAFEPRNYDGRFHGAVPLEDVVARSLNVPTLRLAARLGTARVLDFFVRAGLTSLRETPDHYGANVALGDGEVTLVELLEAYGALAHDGVARPLRAHEGVAVSGRRLVGSDVARIVSLILDDDRRRAPSFERDGVFSAPYALAVKTGTSRDHRDAWAIGYTRTMLAGVWFGRADGGGTREVNGARGPGPVLRAILDATSPTVEPFPGPNPEVWVERSVHVGGAGPLAERERRGFRRRVSAHDAPASAPAADGSHFVFPVNGARFVLDPARPSSAQALRVTVHRPPAARGHALVRDGSATWSADADRSLALPLTVGAHRLELVEDGRVVDVREVEVRAPRAAAFPP